MRSWRVSIASSRHSQRCFSNLMLVVKLILDARPYRIITQAGVQTASGLPPLMRDVVEG